MSDVIVEKGEWYDGFCGGTPRWLLNYSSILTSLIQNAGRWCEHYASDLFIFWNSDVEQHMHDKNWTSFCMWLGFYDCGIDYGMEDDPTGRANIVRQNWKKSSRYYRKVMLLKVEIEGKDLTMSLKTID